MHVALTRAAALGFALLVPALASAQNGPAASQLEGLRIRTIGPANMSGRIVDLDVNERNPYVIWAASSTGGVWKSATNGVTWEPVFEKEGTHSVGDIAIHPVDTAVVWVGTGERANRQSTSWGDGVYAPRMAAARGANMGLRDSHHIGRIALHPTSRMSCSSRRWVICGAPTTSAASTSPPTAARRGGACCTWTRSPVS
jgi:hypothetical protein